MAQTGHAKHVFPPPWWHFVRHAPIREPGPGPTVGSTTNSDPSAPPRARHVFICRATPDQPAAFPFSYMDPSKYTHVISPYNRRNVSIDQFAPIGASQQCRTKHPAVLKM